MVQKKNENSCEQKKILVAEVGKVGEKEESASNSKVEDRILGCIYGGAVGDALGYFVEFMSQDEIHEKYGTEGIQYYDLKNGEATFSDDTQMLLFTLEGIYLWRETCEKEKGAKLKNSLFVAYRDWFYTQLNDCESKEKHKPKTRLYLIPKMHRRRAPGTTCIRSLREKRVGSIENPRNDSKGNGGVMRVAPIGFMFLPESTSLEEVMWMGAESAAITHGHPLGFISAAMMAGLIRECVYGEYDTLKEIVLNVMTLTLKMFGHIPETKELEALVHVAIQFAESNREDTANISMLGNSFLAESAMAIAVYCSLKYERDFGKAIQTAVNFAGDSDTVAAITGNILGAWKGIQCMERKWIEPLHLEQYLEVFRYYTKNDKDRLER